MEPSFVVAVIPEELALRGAGAVKDVHLMDVQLVPTDLHNQEMVALWHMQQ
jgi:hypothetical protein